MLRHDISIVTPTDNQNISAAAGKPKTLAELLREKKPATDVDRTLTAGYFLEKMDNQKAFNADDLEDAFFKVKDRIPSNVNDAVNKNVRKGTMMEAKEKKNGKKAWVVTRTGEEFVEAGFGK